MWIIETCHDDGKRREGRESADSPCWCTRILSVGCKREWRPWLLLLVLIEELVRNVHLGFGKGWGASLIQRNDLVVRCDERAP